jgi:hypothetical protein
MALLPMVRFKDIFVFVLTLKKDLKDPRDEKEALSNAIPRKYLHHRIQLF